MHFWSVFKLSLFCYLIFTMIHLIIHTVNFNDAPPSCDLLFHVISEKEPKPQEILILLKKTLRNNVKSQKKSRISQKLKYS
jgi:hypothetical protein